MIALPSGVQVWLAAGANVYFGLQPQVPLGFAEQAAAELSGASELIRDKHAAAP